MNTKRNEKTKYLEKWIINTKEDWILAPEDSPEKYFDKKTYEENNIKYFKEEHLPIIRKRQELMKEVEQQVNIITNPLELRILKQKPTKMLERTLQELSSEDSLREINQEKHLNNIEDVVEEITSIYSNQDELETLNQAGINTGIPETSNNDTIREFVNDYQEVPQEEKLQYLNQQLQ